MSHKNLEAKKRHHYVWAKYLTRWGKGTKNVFYTTKTGKIAYDSVRAIAADNYFYKTTMLTSKHVEVIKSFSRQVPSIFNNSTCRILMISLKCSVWRPFIMSLIFKIRKLRLFSMQ